MLKAILEVYVIGIAALMVVAGLATGIIGQANGIKADEVVDALGEGSVQFIKVLVLWPVYSLALLVYAIAALLD